MHKLFPEIKANTTHLLPVSGGHHLYIEESGNTRGLPVVFVHGGPGAGCQDKHRCFFDPTIYRIILFDQRGAGRSRPHASLEQNTTQDLVEDMEAIRQFFGIDRWVLFGGSWGSTLSLVYAQTYPDRVLGLILRGIFLFGQREIDWFYQDGASRIFPDYWQDYLAPIPEAERHDLVRAHYRHLTGADDIARMASAKAWSVWEGRTATLTPNHSVVDFFSNPHVAMSLARIEAHYCVHGAFLEENQILRDAHRLATVPGYIVQGRYDMCCPMEGAWELHRAWPQAEFDIIPDAGHSATEPGIVDALVRATNLLPKQLRQD